MLRRARAFELNFESRIRLADTPSRCRCNNDWASNSSKCSFTEWFSSLSGPEPAFGVGLL